MSRFHRSAYLKRSAEDFFRTSEPEGVSPRKNLTFAIFRSLTAIGSSVPNLLQADWPTDELHCDFTQFSLGDFEGWVAEVGAGDEELVEREGLIEGASDESRLGLW